MEKQTPFPVLYILMRNDMESMNAGKAMAQASHASNAFVKRANEVSDKTPDVSAKDIDDINLFETWQHETPQGFGTVFVLAVDETQLRQAVEIASECGGYIAGIVNDPSYPLVDGNVFHSLDIDTCGYIFGDKNDELLKAIVGRLPLHP